MIERLQAVLKYENRYVQVYDDAVQFPSGKKGTYLRIGPPPERGHGVVVVARYRDQFGLVRVYRYPIGEFQWGFPRGFGDAGDSGPLDTAARELEEELGVDGASLRLLGKLTPDSGMLSSRVYVVEALVESSDDRPSDLDEIESWRWMPQEELIRCIGRGEIEDAFTLSALMLLMAAAG